MGCSVCGGVVRGLAWRVVLLAVVSGLWLSDFAPSVRRKGREVGAGMRGALARSLRGNGGVLFLFRGDGAKAGYRMVSYRPHQSGSRPEPCCIVFSQPVGWSHPPTI